MGKAGGAARGRRENPAQSRPHRRTGESGVMQATSRPLARHPRPRFLNSTGTAPRKPGGDPHTPMQLLLWTSRCSVPAKLRLVMRGLDPRTHAASPLETCAGHGLRRGEGLLGLVPGFTKKYGIKVLVYYEQHPTALTAMQREKK